MPIRIKKPPFKHCDKVYRWWTVAAMVMSVLLTAALTVFIREVSKNTEPAAWAVLLAAGAYLLFAAACVGAAVTGIRAYQREDNGTDLFQGIIYLLAVIFCLLNLRFMTAAALSSVGAESAADKLIGNVSYNEFIAGNYTYWVLLAAGIFAAFVVGVFGSVKLIKNREKKDK